MVMIVVVAVAVALGASVEHVANVRGRASHEVTIDRLGKVVGVTANVSDKVAFFGGTHAPGVSCLHSPHSLPVDSHPLPRASSSVLSCCGIPHILPDMLGVQCGMRCLCVPLSSCASERDHELFSCSTRPSSVRPTPGMGKTGGTGCAHPEVNDFQPFAPRMSADWHTHYPRVRVRSHALVGIQYGDAPIGDLRWEPPKPFGPWDGVRDASEYGAMCSQGKNDEIVPFPTPMSEDCELSCCWGDPVVAIPTHIPLMFESASASVAATSAATAATVCLVPRSLGVPAVGLYTTVLECGACAH